MKPKDLGRQPFRMSQKDRLWILLILAPLVLIAGCLGQLASVGIIGGADGPTAIWVSGGNGMEPTSFSTNLTQIAILAIPILLWSMVLAMGVFLFVMVVKLIRKAMVALDIYIEKNRMQGPM